MFNKKYYFLDDYFKNCKHKIKGQTSYSCRRRKDGTTIGSFTCRLVCPHNKGYGEDRNGKWIKCKYLKGATGV